MYPGGSKSIRVQYYFIPILFEESLKIYYFFKQTASREKKFELHQMPGSFENYLLNSNN